MDEKDLDKQMGELDGNDAEKLDEQIWGSDEEEEEEQKVWKVFILFLGIGYAGISLKGQMAAEFFSRYFFHN